MTKNKNVKRFCTGSRSHLITTQGNQITRADVPAPLKLRPYGAIQICLLLLLLLLLILPEETVKDIVYDVYWHYPHSMRSRLHATVGRPSVCPSVPSGCGGFAAVGPAAGRYRSIAARPADSSSHAAARRAAANAARSATSSAHTRLTAPLSGTTRVSRYQKGKTNLDFTEARDSEWQWHQLAICKSAPSSRQITMPAPHHSIFYRPDALPAAQPTASKHWRSDQWRSHTNGVRGVRTPCQENT